MTLQELLGDAYKEGLTVDDIATVIQGIDLNADKQEITRLKGSIDKLSAENADWKRKHKELLSEDERKSAERDEAYNKALEENKTLKRERDIANNAKQFALQGYSETLALDTATALYDGDMGKVFANQKTFLEEHDKALKAERMRNVPDPAAGGGQGDTVVDYQKEIQNAYANGDTARVASLMRLQQEQNK